MKKDATKRQGSTAPRDLINQRTFFNVMGFPGLIQRQGLASWNIKSLWNKDSFDCCAFVPSTL